MKHDIINLDAKTVGSIELADSVFGAPVREDILARVIQWQLDKRRAGTHKTKDLGAHDVFIYSDTPLAKILGEGHIKTNSRHREAMMPNDHISDLKIYASTADGTPEAWGNEEKNILCIQWHPEDFAAQGDTKMQKIYDWLAEKALQHKQMQMQKQRQSWQKKSLLSR